MSTNSPPSSLQWILTSQSHKFLSITKTLEKKMASMKPYLTLFLISESSESFLFIATWLIISVCSLATMLTYFARQPNLIIICCEVFLLTVSNVSQTLTWTACSCTSFFILFSLQSSQYKDYICGTSFWGETSLGFGLPRETTSRCPSRLVAVGPFPLYSI